jgi:hypothetical protein
MRVVALVLLFRPFGLVLFLKCFYPRLAPWAAFQRRFAAKIPSLSGQLLGQNSRARILLAGLCRYKSLIVVTGVWNHLHTVLQSSIESIGKSGGKIHGEKIDIELQVPLRIQTVNH